MNNEDFLEAEIEVELTLEQELSKIKHKDNDDLDRSVYVNKKRKPGRPKSGEIILKPIKRSKPGRPPVYKEPKVVIKAQKEQKVKKEKEKKSEKVVVEETPTPKNGVGRPATRHLPNQNQLMNYRQKVYQEILSVLNQDIDYEQKLDLIAREFSGSDIYFEHRYITLEQCVFLSIYEHNLCNEYEALKLSGVETIRTLYNWKAHNKHFLAAYNYLLKDRIRLVEQTLFEDAINNKNPASCMFLLKKLSREKYGDNDNTTKDTQIVGTNLIVATNNNN